MARSRPGSAKPVATAPVTLAPVVLPDLVPADRDVFGAAEPLEALVFDDVDLSGLVHADAELLDCRLTGCRLDGARLRRGRLVTCVLSELHATSLDVADSSWRDVLLSDCRIGALTAPGLQLRSVTVRGGKLDFVNLRGADLDRVRFEGCRIGELDLGAAHVHDVRLDETQVDRLVLGGASCADVHLEQGVVGMVEGVPGLHGVTVSRSQLDALAPDLAAHVGWRSRPTDRAERGHPAGAVACTPLVVEGGPVLIDKQRVLGMIADHGDQSKLHMAENDLSDPVDTDLHAGLLGRLGLDPAVFAAADPTDHLGTGNPDH